jgi:hypothetical protein
MRIRLAAALLAAAVSVPAAEPTPAPPNAYLYIGWPNDGQVVASGKPIRVWFGLRNMGVAPKGVKFPYNVHDNLVIDTDGKELCVEFPNHLYHLHFGAGETEARIELPPGTHTLQLLLADKDHIPHDPPVYSKKITVTVK